MNLGVEVDAPASPRADLRARWALLALSALVTYSIVPMRSATFFNPDSFSFWLQALMFILSFPCGSLFALGAHAVTDGCAECSVAQNFMIWCVALGLGFLQWFYVLPILFRRRGEAEPTVALNLSGAASAAVEGATMTGAPCDRLRAAHEIAAGDQPVRPFDERGRTPVERVLGNDL